MCVVGTATLDRFSFFPSNRSNNIFPAYKIPFKPSTMRFKLTFCHAKYKNLLPTKNLLK